MWEGEQGQTKKMAKVEGQQACNRQSLPLGVIPYLLILPSMSQINVISEETQSSLMFFGALAGSVLPLHLQRPFLSVKKRILLSSKFSKSNLSLGNLLNLCFPRELWRQIILNHILWQATSLLGKLDFPQNALEQIYHWWWEGWELALTELELESLVSFRW